LGNGILVVGGLRRDVIRNCIIVHCGCRTLRSAGREVRVELVVRRKSCGAVETANGRFWARILHHCVAWLLVIIVGKRRCLPICLWVLLGGILSVGGVIVLYIIGVGLRLVDAFAVIESNICHVSCRGTSQTGRVRRRGDLLWIGHISGSTTPWAGASARLTGSIASVRVSGLIPGFVCKQELAGLVCTRLVTLTLRRLWWL
jgi:hypothetical protein